MTFRSISDLINFTFQDLIPLFFYGSYFMVLTSIVESNYLRVSHVTPVVLLGPLKAKILLAQKQAVTIIDVWLNTTSLMKVFKPSFDSINLLR